MNATQYNGMTLGSGWCEIDKKTTYVDPITCMSDGEAHLVIASVGQTVEFLFEDLLPDEMYKIRQVISQRCNKLKTVPVYAENQCCPEDGKCIEIIVDCSMVHPIQVCGPATFLVRSCGSEQGAGPISYQVY